MIQISMARQIQEKHSFLKLKKNLERLISNKNKIHIN